MPHKYFRIDGVATYVHHTGATTLPERPPASDLGETVLCLHGAGGNGNQFRGVLRALSAHHSPLAFDQPAHGRSGGLDSLADVGRMADFTLAFIDKLGLGAPVLLGHSLGGAVALRCALDRPDGIRGLVLCSSAARFPAIDSVMETTRLIVEGKARRRFLREAYSPSTENEILSRGFMEDLKTDPRANYGDLQAARDWNAEAELAAVRVPTRVIVGADEFEPMREQSELLASRIPGAGKTVIPKAGHVIPLEQPEALALAVEEFCAGLSA